MSWFAKRRTTRTTKVGLAISDPSKMATNNCVHNTSFIKELNSWYTASVNACVMCKTWTYDVCQGLKNAGQLEQLKLACISEHLRGVSNVDIQYVCHGLQNAGQLEQLKLEWLYQTLLRWPPNKRVHNTSFIKEKNSWCTASVNTCVVCKMWTYNTCVMVCKMPDNWNK